jgi:glycosyltransferase involved in cell wall biosynthesis
MVRICALIAAYNEAPHVGGVVAATLPYVDRVFVVDDGSTDDTAAAAQAAGATVWRHEHNQGKGCAIRTGLVQILRWPYTHVLFLDGDGQHDPLEIPMLIDCVEHGTGDFVIAERELKKDAMPAARFYSNVIGSRILSGLIGVNVADSQSGFRLIRTDLLRVAHLTGRKYEIETEMLIKLIRAGATLERVSVQRLQYEGTLSKIRPFRDTFRTCMLALRYRFFDGRTTNAN